MQTHNGHPAIDVKLHGVLAFPGTPSDADRQAAYEVAQEEFWNFAKVRAKEVLGTRVEVVQAGRSGGWLEVHGVGGDIDQAAWDEFESDITLEKANLRRNIADYLPTYQDKARQALQQARYALKQAADALDAAEEALDD